MARYIDVDALLSRLPDDLPYKASVKRVLMQAPEADVVPKSEVAILSLHGTPLERELKEANKKLIAEKILLESGIVEKGIEIKCAREIFEEIEQETKNHGITYAQRKIAELKKKYTEGKK